MNNKGKKVLTDEELQQVSGGVLIDSIIAEVPCNRFKTENDCIARDHCEWSMGGYCEEAVIPIENAH